MNLKPLFVNIDNANSTEIQIIAGTKTKIIPIEISHLTLDFDKLQNLINNLKKDNLGRSSNTTFAWNHLTYPNNDNYQIGAINFKEVHETVPIGINKKLFYSFNYLLNDLTYEKISNEINDLIALKKPKTPIFGVHGQIPKKLQNSDKKHPIEVLSNNPEKFVELKNMDYNARVHSAFAKDSTDMITMWTSGLLIHAHGKWNENIIDHIPITIDFIKKLPVKSLGRIMLLITKKNHEIACHRDWFQVPHRDHHFNITSHVGRPSYVYDSLNNKKHYLKSDYRMYAFNLRDLHGVDSYYQDTWTLRILCEYNDELQQYLNLKDGLI